jgi:hypothetical protein
MKKYRITSIPQSLPKAKKGKAIKIRKNQENKDFGKRRYTEGIFRNKKSKQEKNKSDNSMINYDPSNSKNEVQLNLPKQDYTWNTGTDIYRPGYFDELYKEDYTSDLFDPFFHFTNLKKDNETGKYIDCPPGYTAYKGECLPSDETDKLYQKEFDKWGQTETQKIRDKEAESQAEIQEDEQVRLQEYQDVWKNSKKKDKIKPQYHIPAETLANRTYPVFNEDGSVQTDENGNVITQSAIEAVKSTHYVQKNEDNTYSMYPKQLMVDRIINNGFFNNEFEQYWGLDPKQVKEQFGDIQEEARNVYENSVIEKVYNQALDKGQDVNTVIDSLPKSVGYNKNLKDKFQKPISEEIQRQYKQMTKDIMSAYDENILKRDEYDLKTDFDFENASGISNEGESKVWHIVNDVDNKFSKHWINQAKTEEEKKKRKAEVKEIKDKYYKNDPETIEAFNSAALQRELEEEAYSNWDRQLNMTVGHDRTESMDHKRLYDRLLGNESHWNQELKNEREGKRASDMDMLTGQSGKFQWFMDDKVGKGEEKRRIMQEGYDSDKITEADKTTILGSLKRSQEDSEAQFELNTASGDHIFTKAGKEDELNNLYSDKSYRDHLWDLPQYQKMKDGQGHFKKEDMAWYNYLWDVTTNPGDAIGYAIDPTKEMWPDKFDGISYNQRQEAQRLNKAYEKPDGTYGTSFDNLTYTDIVKNAVDNPLNLNSGLSFAALGSKFFNTLNPFNIGDELYRADDKWSRAGELGFDAALDLATLVSLGGSQALKVGVKGTQLLNAYNKASKLKNMLSGLSKMNPISKMAAKPGVLGSVGRYGQRWGQNFTKFGTPVFAYESVRPGGYLPNAVNDFSEGNISEGLGNLGWGALNLAPYGRYGKSTFNAATGIGRGIKNRNLVIQNPASNYSFTVGNPNTGKGFFYGNPEVIKKGTSLFPKANRFMLDKTDNMLDLRKRTDSRFVKAPKFNTGGSVDLPKAYKGLITKSLKTIKDLTNVPALTGVKIKKGDVGKIWNPYFKKFVDPSANLGQLNMMGDMQLNNINTWEESAKRDKKLLQDKALQINNYNEYEAKATEEFNDYMKIYNELSDAIRTHPENSEEYKNAIKLFNKYIVENQPPFTPSTMQNAPYELLSEISNQSQNIVKSEYEGMDYWLDRFNLQKANDQLKIDAYKDSPLSYKLFGLSPGWKFSGKYHPYDTDVLLPYHNANKVGEDIYDKAWSGEWDKLNALQQFHPFGNQGPKSLELMKDKQIYLGSKKSLRELIFPDYTPPSDDDLFQNQEKDGGVIPKAKQGLITKGLKAFTKANKDYGKFKNAANTVNKVYVPNSTKQLLRDINTQSLGTVNSFAKLIAPVMAHPARALVLGAPIEGVGPFTGSPLNSLPFYGQHYPTRESNKLDGIVFRKMGDNLDGVKNTGIISPEHGAKFRMGKNTIVKEGNWGEEGYINEKYPGVFMTAFNPYVPGSNIQTQAFKDRDGVLVNEGFGKPFNSIMDPGVSLHRRLPFSNKYTPIDMDKLKADEFDWRTQGGYAQSLIERLAYLGAAGTGLSLLGGDNPVHDIYNENIYKPIGNVIGKIDEKIDEYIEPKKMGGMVLKLDENQIAEYAKNGYIIEDV